MPEATQASVTPAAAVVETPAPATDPQSQQPGGPAVAQAAETPESEQKKANDKLAERGRELKAERERVAALTAQLEEARSKGEKLWYTHPDTPEEEKAAFRNSREQAAKDAPKMAALQNKAALSDAIADEESPVVRAALRALRTKAETSGKYPDADFISAVRESLTPAEGTEPAVEEKTPPAVRANRGTQTVAGPSIDAQIAELEKAVKTDKSRYGELLNLRAEKTAMEKAAHI